MNLVEGAMDNAEKGRKHKQKRSHPSPGSLKKKNKRPRPDTSSSSDEAGKDIIVDISDSKFDKGSLEWRRERQWKMAFVHTQLYRISQEIHINKLNPEPNKKRPLPLPDEAHSSGWTVP